MYTANMIVAVALFGFSIFLALSIIQAFALREKTVTIRNLRNALTKEYREHAVTIRNLRNALTKEYREHDREVRRLEARFPAHGHRPDPRLNKHSTLPEFYGQLEPSENPDLGRTTGVIPTPRPVIVEIGSGGLGGPGGPVDPPPAPMSAPPVPVQAVGDR